MVKGEMYDEINKKKCVLSNAKLVNISCDSVHDIM